MIHHLLLDVLELLLITGQRLRIRSQRVVCGLCSGGRDLHLSAIYLDGSPIDTVLARISSDHLVLHGSTNT